MVTAWRWLLAAAVVPVVHTALIRPVSTASSATAMTCPFTRVGSYATPRSSDDDPPPDWLVRVQSHWCRAEGREADVASRRMFGDTAQFVRWRPWPRSSGLHQRHVCGPARLNAGQRE
jgi:hypothetical protein